MISLLTTAFILAHFYPALLAATRITFFVFVALVALDVWLLYRVRTGISGTRVCPDRLSNGDENPISIELNNHYTFPLTAEVIDELPLQFQARDNAHHRILKAGMREVIAFTLRPTERGLYRFGHVNVLACTPLHLVQRRYQVATAREVPVYPSFLQMRGFELMAASNRLHEVGVKRIRRIGQASAFERIKEYVVGDDPRTVNWRATARRGELMVNQYQDERAQPVYCLLDAGRVMELPFDGMTLLDHSINASLVISNVALKKQDKVGLIAFSSEIHNVLPASAGVRQLGQMMDRLYGLQTNFLATDYERLYSTVRRQARQRSLMLLFTNFASMAALKRQLPYLKALARNHLLVVIFFENTELTALASIPPADTAAVYTRTIAAQFMLQKQQIVKELQKHLIQSVLTRPENLSVDTLNKYLELKARGLF
ncbi:MAG: DUF58 domain-containing protein [Bacteroidota bacterium]